MLKYKIPQIVTLIPVYIKAVKSQYIQKKKVRGINHFVRK